MARSSSNSSIRVALYPAQPSICKDADYQFHLSIIVAARNSFFISAYEALKTQIEYGIRLNRRLSLHQSLERMLLVQHEHLAILNAIKARDVDGVRAAMRMHLIGARARLLGDKSWRGTAIDGDGDKSRS